MSEEPAHRPHWRVGYRADPLGFAPWEICEWNHRFDDRRHRFRTLYVAELAETALRETLAAFRPKLSAIHHFQQEMGAGAARELASWPIAAAWRSEHVLTPARPTLSGPICDLTDVSQRRTIEEHHAQLLIVHGLQHLNLHEITTSRRVITQTIATNLYDEGVAAIRFPSNLDGNPCLAVFEGRGELDQDGAIMALTDPPPEVLLRVAADWRLSLQPATATSASARSRPAGSRWCPRRSG